MLNGFLETQKAAVTVGSFVATYFIVLTIGRLLKRRAGVHFGILFQLFCLTLAFYVALGVAGIRGDWENYLGSLLILLATGVVIALIDRYIWDYYFEKKKQTPIPHFPRQLAALLLYLIVLVAVLWYGYHAGRWLTGLLATSGVSAIIIGLAGQNLLGGIIAGVSLQIGRPYKVGDWLQVSDRFAEVMEINWRSTRLRTNDNIYLDIPNNEIIRQTIVNLHYPTELHAMRIRIGIDYNTPPNRVKDALFHAASTAAGVLPQPPVKVFLVDYADNAMIYEVKYFMGNHARISEINDAVRTNIWYELKRQRIRIPFPTRTLQLERRGAGPVTDDQEEARTILRSDPIFQCLSEEQIDTIVKQSRLDHFGRGEKVIEEGAEGDSMFVLLRGAAQVLVAQNGSSIPVATLNSGDCFGEMSLLTGERRSATVRAQGGDCYVMEISKPVMAEIIHKSPDCLRQLSEILAHRKLETEGILKEAIGSAEQEAKEREYSATFMIRLRQFFAL